mgnify:CR=1 FL=1
MNDNTTPTNDDSKIIAFGKRFEDTKPQEPKHVAKTWWFDWKNSNDQLELTQLEGFIRFNPPYITLIPTYMETSGINDAVFAVAMDRLSGFGSLSQD